MIFAFDIVLRRNALLVPTMVRLKFRVRGPDTTVFWERVRAISGSVSLPSLLGPSVRSLSAESVS